MKDGKLLNPTDVCKFEITAVLLIVQNKRTC